MMDQLLAHVRQWLQMHLVVDQTLFLGVFGGAVLVLVLVHFLKPPRT